MNQSENGLILPEKKPKKQMNDQMRAFADHYLVCFNATEAAIKAGYAEKSAKTSGCRLLADERIAAYLKAQRAKLMKKTEVTQERVIMELARVALSDITDVASWDETSLTWRRSEDLTRRQSAAIKGIKYQKTRTGGGRGSDPVEHENMEIKLHDKVRALDTLAKILGLCDQKKGEDDNQVQHIGVAYVPKSQRAG